MFHVENYRAPGLVHRKKGNYSSNVKRYSAKLKKNKNKNILWRGKTRTITIVVHNIVFGAQKCSRRERSGDDRPHITRNLSPVDCLQFV